MEYWAIWRALTSILERCRTVLELSWVVLRASGARLGPLSGLRSIRLVPLLVPLLAVLAAVRASVGGLGCFLGLMWVALARS